MVFGALVFKLSVWCGAEGYVSSLQAAALLLHLDVITLSKYYNFWSFVIF